MRCKLPLTRIAQLQSSTRLHPTKPFSRRYVSSANTSKPDTDPPADDILPTKPTWSLRSLNSSPRSSSSSSSSTISPQTLHHLLRLSALPLPTSAAEEQKMLRDLHSQLAFVRAVQDVEIPDGVEPLQCVRDETEAGRREGTFGVQELADELGKERVVGKRGRIVRRRGEGGGEDDMKTGKEKGKEKGVGWDLLQLAPKTRGRFVVVDTMRD